MALASPFLGIFCSLIPGIASFLSLIAIFGVSSSCFFVTGAVCLLSALLPASPDGLSGLSSISHPCFLFPCLDNLSPCPFPSPFPSAFNSADAESYFNPLAFYSNPHKF